MKLVASAMLLAGALLLALVSQLATADPHGKTSLLTLWPSDADATLTITDNDQPTTDSWSVQSSNGSILITQAMFTSVAAPMQTDLSSISSIQIVWTPPQAPASSMFDFVFGAAVVATVPGLCSSGFQLRATTSPTGGALELAAIETSVRAMVLAALPSLNESFPERGLLARSLCASTGYKQHTTSTGEACYAWSLPYQSFPAQSHPASPLEALVSEAIRTQTSPLAVIAVSLRGSTEAPSMVSADALLARVSNSSSLDSSAVIGGTRVAVVTNVDAARNAIFVTEKTDASALDHVQRWQPPALPNIHADVVHLDIRGEGFHRVFHLAILITGRQLNRVCGNASIVVRVPLSTSVYADLDELRRLERFGKLQLYSPTKHIEIERPTAVSSQHVIAVAVPFNASEPTHFIDSPIHLRYQSPSNDSFQASVMLLSPELILHCGTGSGRTHGDGLLSKTSAQAQPPSGGSGDSPLDAMLTKWLDQRMATTQNWHRITYSTGEFHSRVDVAVPVGFIPHGQFVGAVTLSVTCLGALLLVYVALSSATPSSSSSPSKQKRAHWTPKTTKME